VHRGLQRIKYLRSVQCIEVAIAVLNNALKLIWIIFNKVSRECYTHQLEHDERNVMSATPDGCTVPSVQSTCVYIPSGCGGGSPFLVKLHVNVQIISLLQPNDVICLHSLRQSVTVSSHSPCSCQKNRLLTRFSGRGWDFIIDLSDTHNGRHIGQSSWSENSSVFVVCE
jgi:hypothetical protein